MDDRTGEQADPNAFAEVRNLWQRLKLTVAEMLRFFVTRVEDPPDHPSMVSISEPKELPSSPEIPSGPHPETFDTSDWPVPDQCPVCGSQVVFDGAIDRLVCARWPECSSTWT